MSTVRYFVFILSLRSDVCVETVCVVRRKGERGGRGRGGRGGRGGAPEITHAVVIDH